MKRGWYWTVYLLMALSVGIAVTAIALLPDSVPIRFDPFTGEVYKNGTGSKWMHAVLSFLAVLTGILVLATIKPEREKEWILTAIFVLTLFDVITFGILIFQLSV